MCGLNYLFKKYSGEDVEVMNHAIAHRGIRSRVFELPDGALGHVRLPIQDLSPESDQPMDLGCGVIGAFVGEVFNFRDFDPTAKTDFPVWYYLFTQDRLREADGFWSTILVELPTRQVVVSTDPLGKKPLYFRTDRHRGISSEMDPLVNLGPVTPDELYYSMVAKWGYCMTNHTPFREIILLPAGALVVFDRDGEILSITHGEVQPAKFDPANDGENLRQALTTAVRNRTIADVPISVLLSGGLDSTIVFELLKQTGVPFTAYHVDNEEAQFLKYLDFPEQVTLKNLELEPIGDIEDLIRSSGVPVDLGSVIPQDQIARAIQSDGCQVALSGDGADELFGGYRRAREYDSQHSDVFCELTYYHLPRLDKLMMRRTIELRCPFLSVPVVEQALSLPWKGFRTKKEYLKDTFRTLVPQQILDREKQPLKSPPVRKHPKEWRMAMIRAHRKVYFG